MFGAAMAGCLALGTGCPKEDPGPGKLFEEEGAYELVRFDLEGGGSSEIFTNARKEAFLMRLHATEQVAEVAMCGETEDDTPDNSQCRLSADAAWFCSCFGYAYEEETMLWRRFQAGQSVPMVEFGEDAEPMGSATATDTDGGAEVGDVDPAGDTAITLIESASVKGEYVFAPLPVDVFGSDGLSSTYTFQQRAPSIYDQVFNDPDGRPGCTPCISE